MREKPQRGRERGIGAGNQVLGQVNCLPQCGVAYPNASLRPAPTAMACTVGPGLRLAVYCASAVRLARSMASAPIG